MEYIPKKNYDHQEFVYQETRDKQFYGYFCEQGVGKSKMAIDCIGHHWAKGNVNFILLFSVSGVHRAWKDIEIPKFLNIEKQDYRTFIWPKGFNNSSRKQQSQFKHTVHSCLKRKKLTIVIANIESLSRQQSLDNLLSMLELPLFDKDKSMLVVDESSRIKNMSAKRTKLMLKLGDLFKYKRLLTGTPVTENPTNIFAQLQLMSPEILSNVLWGVPDIYVTDKQFKEYFIKYKKDIVHAGGQPKAYNKEVGVKPNREKEFQTMLQDHSFRIKLDECRDMPEKIYEPVFVDMSPKQEKIYNQLVANSDLLMEGEVCKTCQGSCKIESITMQDESKEIACPDCVEGIPLLSIPHILSRLKKLQQITSGYVFYEEKKVLIEHPKDNPKIQFVLDLLKDGKPTIIWTCGVFESEILHKIIPDSCLYYGKTDPKIKQDIVNNFNKPDYPYKHLIMTEQSGSTGFNFQKAARSIFYSCEWSLEKRIQAEGRNRRIDSEGKNVIIDLMCKGTIDDEIHHTLNDKKALVHRLVQTRNEWANGLNEEQIDESIQKKDYDEYHKYVEEQKESMGI